MPHAACLSVWLGTHVHTLTPRRAHRSCSCRGARCAAPRRSAADRAHRCHGGRRGARARRSLRRQHYRRAGRGAAGLVSTLHLGAAHRRGQCRQWQADGLLPDSGHIAWQRLPTLHKMAGIQPSCCRLCSHTVVASLLVVCTTHSPHRACCTYTVRLHVAAHLRMRSDTSARARSGTARSCGRSTWRSMQRESQALTAQASTWRLRSPRRLAPPLAWAQTRSPLLGRRDGACCPWCHGRARRQGPSPHPVSALISCWDGDCYVKPPSAGCSIASVVSMSMRICHASKSRAANRMSLALKVHLNPTHANAVLPISRTAGGADGGWRMDEKQRMGIADHDPAHAAMACSWRCWPARAAARARPRPRRLRVAAGPPSTPSRSSCHRATLDQ